jgi:catechol 2,3-dioxygenase-like lactoylglutathione lyase family enzyme
MAADAKLITGTDFICLPVQDIERARKFYGETLGLEESKQWGDMPAFEYETGSLTIALMQPDAFGLEFQPHSLPVALHVADVAAAKEQLAAEGVEFIGDIIDSGVCHQQMFKDPDGNMLDLHHRYAKGGMSEEQQEAAKAAAGIS